MSHTDIRPARFAVAGAALLVPALSAFALLAFTGRIGTGLAIGLGTLVSGITLAVLLVVYRDSRLLAAQIERMAKGGAPGPEGLAHTGTAEILQTALTRLHQEWNQRVTELEAGIATDQAVLEALHDPLLLVDAQRRVTHANAAARALLGDRVLQRDLAVLLRNPPLLAAVDMVLAGEPQRRVEFTLSASVERILEARVKPFAPVGTAGADSPVLILTLHDITAIKRSEQMRADFVANASHELRTPLSSLLGFIETLRGPARDDPEAHERFLGIMHDQAGRMSRLINDLLSLSRIELDEHSPPTGRADLLRIVRTAVTMLELKAAQRKIALAVEAPDSLPPVIGDEDQLTQVVQNLIDNAIKYTREKTEVRITLALSAPRQVSLAVRDQGEGIARTHLPRLTERFYRVDPARSRALGGTGLGLAIVKHIVNRHRGRLLIDSEVGKGSLFTVLLPTAADAAPRRPAAGEHAA